MSVICICVSLLNCFYYNSVLPCIHGQSYMFELTLSKRKRVLAIFTKDSDTNESL